MRFLPGVRFARWGRNTYWHTCRAVWTSGGVSWLQGNPRVHVPQQHAGRWRWLPLPYRLDVAQLSEGRLKGRLGGASSGWVLGFGLWAARGVEAVGSVAWLGGWFCCRRGSVLIVVAEGPVTRLGAPVISWLVVLRVSASACLGQWLVSAPPPGVLCLFSFLSCCISFHGLLAFSLGPVLSPMVFGWVSGLLRP